MKKLVIPFVLLIASLLSLPAFAQNNNEPVALGLPGDNLNLYAVLELLQKSPTLEGFEKSLNDKETKINNLDLNNDKLVDYIKVVNVQEGKSHTVILRIAINDKENQDVAVIEINKDAAGNVAVQIIGDEDLYGKDYIIEPSNSRIADGTPNPAYIDTDADFYYANNWPVVEYLFSPGYIIYVSPWYWSYYPTYWYPRVPILYYDYWSFYYPYYINPFYTRVSYIRYPIPYLSYVKIRNKSAVIVQNRRNGIYNATYDGRIYKKPAAPASRKVAPQNEKKIKPTPAIEKQPAPAKKQIPEPVKQDQSETPARQKQITAPIHEKQAAPAKKQVPEPVKQNQPAAPVKQKQTTVPTNEKQPAPAKKQIPEPFNRTTGNTCQAKTNNSADP